MAVLWKAYGGLMEVLWSNESEFKIFHSQISCRILWTFPNIKCTYKCMKPVADYFPAISARHCRVLFLTWNTNVFLPIHKPEARGAIYELR